MAGDNPNFPTGTASINWFDSNGGLHIRVYSTDGYNVIERCSDAGGSGWTTGSFSQPGSQVSAIVWQAGGTHIRVYCTSGDKTTEWCSDPGSGGWTQGSYTTT